MHTSWTQPAITRPAPLRRRARLAIVVALVAACGSAPAAAEVNVGIAVPAEGPWAGVGDEIRRAAADVVSEINESGGVLGERLKSVSADDKCSAKHAAEAAHDLIARGVKVVVGHPCASAAIAAAPIYAQAGIVFIAPLTRHPVFTEQRAGPTIFRLAGRNDGQAAAAAKYFSQAHSGEPIAIVTDGSLYARELAGRVRTDLKSHGFINILNATVNGAQKDFSAMVAKFKDAGTKALFFAGLPMEGALLLKQMRTAGLKTIFVGSDALGDEHFVETAGAAATGALVLFPFEPAPTRAQPDNTKGPAHKTSSAALATQAAMDVWIEAVRRAGSTASERVSGTIQLGIFPTPLGQISFNEIGDANVPDYTLKVWRQGAWHPVD